MNDVPHSNQPIEKTATEARQGRMTGHVRWILALSFVGAIVALAFTYVAVIH